jgi:hypothetical protein
MSDIYRDTTVTLTDEEKNILKQAIKVCEQIARDCNNEDMFVDASTIFSNIYDNYKNGELPKSIHIYE